MLTPFEKGLVAHLVADWILQNDWMARNKMKLSHPAAWVHSTIQGLGLGVALGWQAGLVLGFVRNKRDGTVEAVFEGSEKSVTSILKWCKKGPPIAKVTNVDVTWEDYKGEFNSFDVTY